MLLAGDAVVAKNRKAVEFLVNHFPLSYEQPIDNNHPIYRACEASDMDLAHLIHDKMGPHFEYRIAVIMSSWWSEQALEKCPQAVKLIMKTFSNLYPVRNSAVNLMGAAQLVLDYELVILLAPYVKEYTLKRFIEEDPNGPNYPLEL